MKKRTAREINVNEKRINNKNINVKIGTVENRDCPETIYINIAFWIKPTKNQKKSRESLEQSLKLITDKRVNTFLKKSLFFPMVNNNIYICNIPQNFNYNNKYNFVSMELNFSTLNIYPNKKYPLSIKKDTDLFDECVNFSNFVGERLVKLEKKYDIRKSAKKNIPTSQLEETVV